MEQLIFDNQNFIYYLFNLTAGFLQAISLLTGLSYQFWNIVIWFGLLPAIWIYMIGCKTTKWINLSSVLLLIVMFKQHKWNYWFDLAVVFLNDMCSVFGPDYRQMSVYICLFVPLIITIVLCLICLSRVQRVVMFSSLLGITVLTTIGFPISNYLLSNYFHSKYTGHSVTSDKIDAHTLQNLVK